MRRMPFRTLTSSYGAWALLVFLVTPLLCGASAAYRACAAPFLATPTAMKNLTAIQNSTAIKIAITTWNLAESTPRVADCEFIQQFQDQDIVVLGVQECEDLRPRANEGRRSLAWSVLQRYSLGPEFVRLKKLRMGGIQMSVFAKKNFSKEVQDVKGMCVPCGIGNIMVNKGAVCAMITVRNTSIGLVNVHLAAHEHALQRRNADYLRIKDKIASTAENYWNRMSPNPSDKRSTNRHRKLPPVPKKAVSKVKYRKRPTLDTRSRRSNPNDPVEHVRSFAQNVLNMDRSTLDLALDDVIGVRNTRMEHQLGKAVLKRRRDSIQNTWPFDATFFFGDLNYRVQYPVGRKGLKLRRELNQQLAPEKSKEVIDSTSGVKQRVISELLKYDQLSREMKQPRGNVLKDFKEMPISFLPTYKYDKRVNKFDSSGKKRKPSYTDRVLFSVSADKEEVSGSAASRENRVNSTTLKRTVVVSPSEYWSASSCLHGDHRPVCAKFKISI